MKGREGRRLGKASKEWSEAKASVPVKGRQAEEEIFLKKRTEVGREL